MILERINADLIATMKDRDPGRREQNQQIVLALRTLLAEVKSFQVNNRKQPEDSDLAAILAKGIKQFRETLDKASGKNEMGAVREDVVERENAKIALYEKYLPAQMGKAEIETLVEKAIAQAAAQSPKDMGAVMAIVRPQTQGRADGKLVSEIVKTKLGG